jgi:phosphate uptake regulator
MDFSRIGAESMSIQIKAEKEYRRIQVTGGSTYILSLPKSWVEKHGLGKGSPVYFVENEDSSLCIKSEEIIRPVKIGKAVIMVSLNDPPDSVVRRLISAYIIGFNIIQIKSRDKRIDTDVKVSVKEIVRKKLVGTEILSESPLELTLQIILSYSELPINDVIKRMAAMTASMHRNVAHSLSSDDPHLANVVVDMDENVDRLSFYVMRLLSVAIMDERILKVSGIASPRQCLGYRSIAKSIEHLADHATNIAKNRLTAQFVSISDEILQELDRLSQSAINVFEVTIKALLDEDYYEANNVMHSSEETRGIEDKVIHRIVQLAPVEDIPQLLLIVDSIVKASEYGAEIAEVVQDVIATDAVSEV